MTVTVISLSTTGDAVVFVTASVLHVVQVQANEAEGRGIFGPLGKEGWSEVFGENGRGQDDPCRPESPAHPCCARSFDSPEDGHGRHEQEGKVNRAPPGGGGAATGARTGLGDKQERCGHAVDHAQEASCGTDGVGLDGKRTHAGLDWGSEITPGID